jgi:hypothetical protein
MGRRSIGLVLVFVLSCVVASNAAAQPRQPRVRVTDESGAPSTASGTSPASDPPSTDAITSPDASSDVRAEDMPASPYTDDADTVAAPTSTAMERLKQHDFGAGYRGIFVASSNGTRYLIHGPTVAYTYFVGRRWGFMMHAQASFPIAGHMSGTDGQFGGALFETYGQRRFSFDGSFMAARRLVLSDRVSLTAAVGVHVQSFELKSIDYLPVEAITGGFGGLTRLEWLVSDIISLGGTFATAIDLLDFVRHTNRAAITVPFSATLNLGLRY